MAKTLKKVIGLLDENGKWTVTIDSEGLPLTFRDQVLLARATRVATRLYLRQYQLKQLALKKVSEKKPELTGTGVIAQKG